MTGDGCVLFLSEHTTETAAMDSASCMILMHFVNNNGKGSLSYVYIENKIVKNRRIFIKNIRKKSL